jgi:phage terminase Nu1 subunit (DNA packaging protein)
MAEIISISRPSSIPELVNTRRAAEILGKSVATLKRWRYEGIGPNWIVIEGTVRYDLAVLVGYIRQNTRVASVRAAMEDIREAV